jgi:hypothetical protein
VQKSPQIGDDLQTVLRRHGAIFSALTLLGLVIAGELGKLQSSHFLTAPWIRRLGD